MGFVHRDITDRLKSLHEKLAALSNKSTQVSEEATKSMLIEPLTPEQQARKEFEDRVKRLNGGKL